MDITITKSKNKDKKFDAIIDGKKRISFGDRNYKDYTQHKDPERRSNYIARHGNENHTQEKSVASLYEPAYFMGRTSNRTINR